jgi:hypothetical protein
LPVFTSGSDNATTIGGGESVNISTVSYDLDTSQTLTLWVCDSNSASFSGCGGNEYCNTSVSSGANLTCAFTAESDSASHTWYAFLYDALGEISLVNASGSYTTDVTSPSVTLVTPTNGSTITQDSVTFTVLVDEALGSAWYSLDGGVTNVTMTNSSLFVYVHTNSSIADGTYDIIFWVNDSYGNEGTLTGNSFTIDTVAPDTTAPTVTVQSPVDGSYSTVASVLLNVTSSEALTWAGYTNNSGTLTDLGNISTTAWNATVTFEEGQQEIIFYANDSSDNQGNASTTVYVDLTNPEIVNFSCTDVNDSADVFCTINATDAIGLKNYKVGHNASGSWENSSLINITGTLNETTYAILSGNHSPIGFGAQLYVYDLSGRLNDSSTDGIIISDDTNPVINNYTYLPNSTDDLDPGVAVNVNATITEDYNISKVYLMYMNSSASAWTYLQMDNNSDLTVGSSSTVLYNATFTPQSETWVFRINATDFSGNENISSNTTLVVENDTSENITTTIEDVVSITYAQRATNNSMGTLKINNTADATGWFNVSLTSPNTSIPDRLSVNYTSVQTGNYSLTPAARVNLTIDINTTNLTVGVYDYNVTIISDSGTTVYEKQLNIQTAVGPYLVTSINTYSSSVTQGDEGVSLVASVTNLGTSDATGVYLNWTLPSGITLASGSLTRNLGTLGVSVSGTNTITADVSSSATSGDVSIFANATSTNADAVGDAKTVTIGTVAVVAPITPVSPAGGGSGSSGISVGGREAAVYDKEIEVIRGESIEFEIEVYNKFQNSFLKDLKIVLTGFPAQYISIVPSEISRIGYGKTGVFVVNLDSPIYQNYEEYDLRAVVTGTLVKSSGSGVSYRETQNIKLIVQAATEEESRFSLAEAEKALQDMGDAGFNVGEAEALLQEAVIKIDSRRNKQAKDLAEELIILSERAFEADKLIRNLLKVLEDPREKGLLTSGISGFAVRGFFEGHPSIEMTELAMVAFDRGDYDLAKKRADSARSLLLFSIRGNIGLFLYLYWYFVLVALLVLTTGGFVGYRKYQRTSVTKRIEKANKQEDSIRQLIVGGQKRYFAGGISAGEYHRIMNQHQRKLVGLKKIRMKLRNQRIKMLGSREIRKELDIERLQVESEIKKIQEAYYREGKISESTYKLEFKVLNERLAEIEGEVVTLHLMNVKKIGNEGQANVLRRETVKAKKGVEVAKKESKEDIEKAKEKFSERIKGDKKLEETWGKRTERGISKVLGFLVRPFGFIKKRREINRLNEEANIRKKVWDQMKEKHQKEEEKTKEKIEGEVNEEVKKELGASHGKSKKKEEGFVSKILGYFKSKREVKRKKEEAERRNKIKMMGVL